MLGTVDDAEPCRHTVATRDREAADASEHQKHAYPEHDDIDGARYLSPDDGCKDRGRHDCGACGLIEHDPLPPDDDTRDREDDQECDRWHEDRHDPIDKAKS